MRGDYFRRNLVASDLSNINKIMTEYHLHHIVPKHMGGSDDESNLQRLTIEEHAEAHRLLWVEHQKREDWLAWQGLAKLIGHDEAIREARLLGCHKNRGKKRTLEQRKKISDSKKGSIPWNKGKKLPPEQIGLRGPLSEETRQKISQTKRSKSRSEKSVEADSKRSETLKGRKISAEHREKLRAAALLRYSGNK